MISSRISGFELAQRRGLFLSTQKAAVYHWQQGRLGDAYLFDATAAGRAHFERYLKETKNSPLYILLDVSAEEFRREKIPHVFGPNYLAIIQRRQKKLFTNTPYCYHEVQGRAADGRRDDLVLLTAITNTRLIDPWLALLDKHKVPVAGIHSVPLFTSALLELIPAPAAHRLIVSLQSVSGLRQTFYRHGKLEMSRLVPLPRYGTEPYAPYIFREVEKICRYINSLQPGGKNAPLHIYFLATGELLAELKQQYKNSTAPHYHYHAVDLYKLPAMENTLEAVSTPFSDQLFMHKLLATRPRNSYASQSNMRYFLMRRHCHLMLAAAVLLVISSALWGGLNLVKGLSYQQKSLAAQNKAQFYAEHNKMAQAKLPAVPVAPADLQLAVELSATLQDYKTTPLETLSLISTGLERLDRIQVSAMQWTSTVDLEFNNDQGEPAANSNTGLDADGYRLYQVSTISGYIEPFDGNFRAAIALINEFAEILRKQKAVYDVSIITLPLDVSSSASLQGDVKTTDKSARFSMRIVLGIADAE